MDTQSTVGPPNRKPQERNIGKAILRILLFVALFLIVTGAYLVNKYVGYRDVFEVPETRSADAFYDPIWQRAVHKYTDSLLNVPGIKDEWLRVYKSNDSLWSEEKWTVRYYLDSNGRIRNEIVSTYDMGILDYLSEKELEEDLRETIDLDRESVFSRNIEDYYLLEKSAGLDTIRGHPVHGFDYIKKTGYDDFWKGTIWLDTTGADLVQGTRLKSPMRKTVTGYSMDVICYYSDGRLDSVVQHIEMDVDLFTYKTKTIGYRTLRDFWEYRPE